MQNALPTPEIERDKVAWRERRGWDVELVRAVECPRGSWVLGVVRELKMTAIPPKSTYLEKKVGRIFARFLVSSFLVPLPPSDISFPLKLPLEKINTNRGQVLGVG